jgi:hypothetical protein
MVAAMKRTLLPVILSLAACGGASVTSDAAPPDAAVDASPPDAPPDQSVSLFTGAVVQFTPDNHRQIDAEVALPAPEASFRQVLLHLTLGCPNNRCDYWDRFGRISIVQDAGTKSEREIEVMRFVTPYRVGMEDTLDVSDLRPLLSGNVTVRVFIDTWVGTGHANGDGWLVDASLEYIGGELEEEVLAVVPLWAPQGVVYGDPLRPSALTTTVEAPVGARAARMWTVITGHGQGNAGNCAEFCVREHTVTVGDQTFAQEIWRDDCETTAAPNQQGTWQYPRAGWCPGALVHPWVQDVSTAIGAGGTLTVGWDAAAYENTCRPHFESCSGCTLNAPCGYNGNNHTEPNYQVSSVIVFLK